jgi:hypothetical protein
LDHAIIEKTGKILITAELGEEYGLMDINGNHPKSQRAELWQVKSSTLKSIAATS